VFDDGDAMNSYMRRDSWYTPDYTLSTLSFDLNREYCALVSQSRMMGVTFSHDVDDRLMIYAGNTPVDGKIEYKMATMHGVNGVLGADCIVVARDPNVNADTSNSTRIFVSDGGLLDNLEEPQSGWSFTRAGDGYAAFRIAGDPGFTSTPSPWNNGPYLEFNDIWAPIAIQCGQAKDFESFEAFKKAVQAQPFTYANGKLTYTSLAGDTIEYWSNTTKIPHVNGKEFNLNPENTFDSPYLKMKHGSNKAVVSYPGYDDLVLDFSKSEQPHK
jgi:hypothetical protein